MVVESKIPFLSISLFDEIPIENELFEWIILLNSSFLFFEDNLLLSLNFNGLFINSFLSSITAAETTGPAKEPLPTSSIPTILLNPELNKNSSIKEWGMELLINDIFFNSDSKVILPSLFLFH